MFDSQQYLVATRHVHLILESLK